MHIIIGTLFTVISIVSSYNSPKYINYMTNKHHKLVPYFGSRYLKKINIPHEHKKDIMQEGYIGLYYAARKYNATRNISFSYYSKFWIMRYFSVALQKYNQEKQFNYPLHEYTKHYTDTIMPNDMEIYSYMQKLPPYYQDILYRRYLKKEKIKDMCICYSVSRNTMSSHLKLALDYLRILYGTNDF